MFLLLYFSASPKSDRLGEDGVSLNKASMEKLCKRHRLNGWLVPDMIVGCNLTCRQWKPYVVDNTIGRFFVVGVFSYPQYLVSLYNKAAILPKMWHQNAQAGPRDIQISYPPLSPINFKPRNDFSWKRGEVLALSPPSTRQKISHMRQLLYLYHGVTV